MRSGCVTLLRADRWGSLLVREGDLDMGLVHLSVLLLLAASHASPPPVSEATILGDWCAGSATAFHEEFSLTIENDKRVFSSWLHQRPATAGTWVLTGRSLTIHRNSGSDFVYSIDSVSSKRMVLREDDGEPEVYVRTGCRRFDAPSAN
jgi:hypothetical protein